MDLHRLFLVLIFTFSSILIWDGWQRYQHPERYIQTEDAVSEKKPALNLASIDKVSGEKQSQNQEFSAKKITVKTDYLEAEINSVGGEISRLSLLKHPSNDDANKPFTLFERGPGSHNYVAQSGLLGVGMPDHNTKFLFENESYELKPGQQELQVRLIPEESGAIKVKKVITFRKSSYQIRISYEIENTSQTSIATSGYFQLIRDSVNPAGSSKFIPTFTGPAVYSEKEKFQKIHFSDIDKGSAEFVKQSDNGWIGMLQHYFVAAWLPVDKQEREYYARKLEGDSYSAGVVLKEVSIKPGEKSEIANTLYTGPAESTLDKVTPGLGLTVDYGWVTVVATPLFWLMSLFHGWTSNWGIAIILLTILIKLFFFPLSAASYRSMAKMRLVAPKLEKIKERYGDDREQLNRAMMDLYKTEKINPLGGCLPVIIQIPVFIALFWAILASVEMRYSPFFGWITDLSKPDPFYILPIIMGLSMIVQSRLNPKPADPMQAKIMQIMPVAFSVVFFFFPAGLVLYSIVNNLLSITQQWYITHQSENGTKVVASK